MFFYRMNPGEEWITQRRGKRKAADMGGEVPRVGLEDILKQFMEEKEEIESEEQANAYREAPEPAPIKSNDEPLMLAPQPTFDPPPKSGGEPPPPEQLPVVGLPQRADFLSMLPENHRVIASVILARTKPLLRLWKGRVIYSDADGDGDGEMGSPLEDLLEWFAAGPGPERHRPFDASAFCSEILIPSGIGPTDVRWWPPKSLVTPNEPPMTSSTQPSKEISLPSSYVPYFTQHMK